MGKRLRCRKARRVKKWLRNNLIKPVGKAVRMVFCGCLCLPVEDVDLEDMEWAHALSLEDECIHKVVRMVEESRNNITAEVEMEAPPRKRSKLSLSRRKDDSSTSTVAVPSTQHPVYPLFQMKGSTDEKDENSQVESDIQLDVSKEMSCDVSTVLHTYDYSEFVPFVGLVNLTNTCYMNSVLQILIHTPHFAMRMAYLQGDLRDIYVEAKQHVNIKQKLKFSKPVFGLLNELCRLFRKVGKLKLNYILAPENQNERLAIEPVRTLDAIGDAHGMFRGSQQHDAQELLRCMLSSLQDANAAILVRQAERREELRVRQEKLAAIMAKKQCRKQSVRIGNGDSVLQNGHNGAVMVPLKELESKEPSKVNGLPNGHNGDAGRPGRVSPVGSVSKTTKKKRLGLGHSKNQIKITKFASPSDTTPHMTVNGHHRHPEASSASNGRPSVKEDEPAVTTKDHLTNGTKDKDVPVAKENGPAVTTKHLSNGTKDKDVPVNTTLAEQVSCVTLDGKMADGTDERMDTGPSVNGSASNGHVQVEDVPTSLMDDMLTAKDLTALEKEDGINMIEDLFLGQLQYLTTCIECECKTSRTENFMDLSLPIKMNDKDQDLQDATAGTSPDSNPDDKADNLSLSWSFETFMASEKLDNENKYRCEVSRNYLLSKPNYMWATNLEKPGPKIQWGLSNPDDVELHVLTYNSYMCTLFQVCGAESEAKRKLYFAKLPKILTIHLIRFEYNPSGYGMRKISSPIVIPSHLRLDGFCTDTCADRGFRYEIYGMILHEGSSQDSGHYVSYVRAPQDYPFLKEFCLRDTEGTSSPPASPSQQADTSDVPVVELDKSSQQEREKKLRRAVAQFDYSGNWVKFNDSYVSLVTEEEMGEILYPERTNSFTPYLLFYKRTDLECPMADMKAKVERNTEETRGSKAESCSKDSPGKEEEKEEDISR
ncbi:ubiquitin carboxyl-terminal hydrolase 1-like [Branchiostoma floridae]|uniref:Ubiquitin carboxyl-terminal hydrolase 1-like n=1 Tax=Branchiostoma floridae TaxID=7739 RepID=A0A9J7M593_BRAFL|nr:ubiquitin carboxyl-terminal hydrolase 1-like [Branchiostoma floridae]